MNDSRVQRDQWSIPTLLLWMVFLLVGLAPEPVFLELRRMSGVLTQDAMVNSPGVISVGFAAFLAAFTVTTAQEQHLPGADVWARALSIGILALVAFLPYTYQHWLDADLAILPSHRRLLYAIGPLKMASWFYLVSLVLRYYALGRRNAFIEAFWPIPEPPRTQEGQSVQTDRPVLSTFEEKAPGQSMPDGKGDEQGEIGWGGDEKSKADS